MADETPRIEAKPTAVARPFWTWVIMGASIGVGMGVGNGVGRDSIWLRMGAGALAAIVTSLLLIGIIVMVQRRRAR